MTDAPALRSSLRFGEFEFTPGLRRLERDGVVVELSSRATDMLAVLTERPGEVITKRELLARVWPSTVVVEGVLRVHMVALRRALGDKEGGARLITTVPGRGYCFVGELESWSSAAPAHVAPRSLPARPAKVVGRDTVVVDLMRQLELRRFVTVVGPGGIGKTTVALLVTHNWVAAHGGVAVFVDLSQLGPDGGEGVPEALCAALGLAPQPPDIGPTESVIAHLGSGQALIVLDTCEGVIEAAARIAESLVASAPGVRVLATSREAMRAEGEVVHRIEPLAIPIAGLDMTAREALEYSAVQLFVQRVTANHLGFELSDRQAATVGAICRELDGIALAIELAAGRVDAFGIQQVADQLSTEFALTWPGRRTAAPRQLTLGATLNWSHELLEPVERIVFRRLSVLVGSFPLDAGIAVCIDDPGLRVEDVVDSLSSLVAKSLLSTLIEGPGRCFRMLDTTRSYALAKLGESGDERAMRRRHAQHYLARLTAADAEEDGPAAVAEQTANVSAALNWAFGALGDPSIGIRLTAAATGLWIRHGLLAECRRWAPLAWARLDDAPVPRDVKTRLILNNALMLTDGIRQERRHALEVAYADSLGQGQLDERVSGLIALWADQHRRGQLAAAERLIDEAYFFEGPDAKPAHRLQRLWLKGMTDHRAGRHAQACKHLTRLLRDYTQAHGRPYERLVGFDLEAAGATILGLSEFLRGNLDEAFSSNDRAIAKARTLSSPVSLKAVLRWRAVMIYFSDKDAIEVDRLSREILPSEAAGDLDGPDGAALAVHGLWFARNGDCVQGAEMVRRGLSACRRTDYLAMQSLVHAEMALQLLRHGARENIDEFTAPLENDEGEDNWSTPEVLRIRGLIAERRGGDLALAEARYREALTLAERQGALTWRLRAAISLADLWLAQGRAEDAAALLSPIRGQFRSGPEWPLLRRASDCLEQCRGVLGVVAGRAL